MEKRLRTYKNIQYVTGDLYEPGVTTCMDITALPFPDNSFDVVYCSHVFEHIPDDRHAIRECLRVLKPSGWAILLVPITAERTFEDPSISDPKERIRLFGQDDHVRRYGPDYVDRLYEAGFSVEISQVADLFSAEDATRMGLTADSGEIYFCTKG
jgi:ubiquinone/menaquinone biosynthesis C-methylase UbiE